MGLFQGVREIENASINNTCLRYLYMITWKGGVQLSPVALEEVQANKCYRVANHLYRCQRLTQEN